MFFMNYVICVSRILNLVGYYPDELMGKTAYQFHNPVDAMKIHNCHTNREFSFISRAIIL